MNDDKITLVLDDDLNVEIHRIKATGEDVVFYTDKREDISIYKKVTDALRYFVIAYLEAHKDEAD